MRPRSGANTRCCRTIALFLNVSMHVSRSFLGSVWRPMAMKCLLAILAVGLLVIGGVAGGGAAPNPSARGFVAGAGGAGPFLGPPPRGGPRPPHPARAPLPPPRRLSNKKHNPREF